MVRRAVHPRGLKQIIPAEEQAGALGAAQHLATTVTHHVYTFGEVDIRNRQAFGGRVH